nr:hypothetical protein OH820_00405 [Streptomyces sp. NBC_00857]
MSSQAGGTARPQPEAPASGAALGSPEGIKVWEPVTTLWQPTRAKADAALAAARR